MATTRWTEDGKGAMVADLCEMTLELPEVADGVNLLTRTRLEIVPGQYTAADESNRVQAIGEVRDETTSSDELF